VSLETEEILSSRYGEVVIGCSFDELLVHSRGNREAKQQSPEIIDQCSGFGAVYRGSRLNPTVTIEHRSQERTEVCIREVVDEARDPFVSRTGSEFLEKITQRMG